MSEYRLYPKCNLKGENDSKPLYGMGASLPNKPKLAMCCICCLDDYLLGLYKISKSRSLADDVGVNKGRLA